MASVDTLHVRPSSEHLREHIIARFHCFVIRYAFNAQVHVKEKVWNAMVQSLHNVTENTIKKVFNK